MTPPTKLAAALLLLPALAGGFGGPQGPPTSAGPRGFFGDNAGAERKWEQRYRSLPQASAIHESNRILSAEPHHVGSPAGEKNARWILSKFREFGLDASIETFYPLFSTPKERVLEMTEPTFFRASLAETPVEGDPTSSQTAEQLPTYNVYSIDGDVTAPLVYVNYGIPADYERLARLGIDPRGKIVLARYGQSWRGIKPKVAAEHGAVACLIYSDPRDDGYFEGDVYPAGPYRPRQGVQRGSVADGPLYPGDPLTPGVGATEPKARFDLKDAKILTKIPVLPISYADAQPLLAALAGPVAPREWRGALPLTYHVGPGPARVHLKLSFDWKITPVRDVIARIPGSAYPDEWVIRGNHHDAWVNGSSDPVSGLSALLEEARALGTLVKEGWRPRRTILLCAWDGEEPGLLGSTEWAETHAAELRNKAVAYINSDSCGRGFFNASGSHSLETLVNEAASEVEDPEKKIAILRRLRLRRIEEARNAEDRRDARERANLRIGALGIGVGLHHVRRSPGDRLPEPRLRRRGGRRRLPLDLRRFRLVLALLRYGFLLRTRAGVDGRDDRDAAGQRGRAPARLHRDLGRRRPLRQGDPDPGEGPEGIGRGAEPPDRRGSPRGRRRPETALHASREGAARSRFRLIASREGVGVPRGGREGVRVGVRLRRAHPTARGWRESTRSCAAPSGRSRGRRAFPGAPGSSTTSTRPASIPATRSRRSPPCAKRSRRSSTPKSRGASVRPPRPSRRSPRGSAKPPPCFEPPDSCHSEERLKHLSF